MQMSVSSQIGTRGRYLAADLSSLRSIHYSLVTVVASFHAGSKFPILANGECTMANFTFSDNGLNLTKQFEGLRLSAYTDQVGVWTIGYGHTGQGVHAA